MDRKQFLEELTAEPDHIKRDDIVKVLGYLLAEKAELLSDIPSNDINNEEMGKILHELVEALAKRIKESKDICEKMGIKPDLRQIVKKVAPKASGVKKSSPELSPEDMDWLGIQKEAKEESGWGRKYDPYSKEKYPRDYYSADTKDRINSIQDKIDKIDNNDDQVSEEDLYNKSFEGWSNRKESY